MILSKLTFNRECRKDKTLYEVIDLESTIRINDIVKYVEDFNFDQYLQEVNDSMTRATSVPLLPPEIQQQIKDLKMSELAQLNLTNLISEV